MKIIIKDSVENPVTLFRRAGYVFQRKDADEMSFVRAFGRSGYPRFHAYTKMHEQNLVISIHLDQKKETYGESTRHQGEYADEGPLKEEVVRIKGIFGGEASIHQ